MKKLGIIALSLMTAAAAGAWTVPDETLHYGVRYKWGLIDANAGVATLTTVNNPASGTFTATLSGKSVDLMGHYYAATDTMVGTIMAGDYRPVYNEHITSEAGEFTIQTITYDHSGDSSKGEIVKRLPDGKVLRSRVSHYAGGLTLDLLAVFYYIRQIPYEEMAAGETVTVNIFAGQTPETLTVTYNGRSTRPVRGREVATFGISLDFSAQGEPGAVDNMEIWLADDDTRVPVQINGSLKIGHIECSLLGEEAYGF